MKRLALCLILAVTPLCGATAQDKVIVIPARQLLDEADHITGTEASSDWSSITIKVDSAEGSLRREYKSGDYARFSKNEVIEYGDGAEYLATVKQLKQQAKSLYGQFQTGAFWEAKPDGQALKSGFLSLNQKIAELDTDNPLKTITTDYIEAFIEQLEYSLELEGGLSAQEGSAVAESFFNTFDFEVMRRLGEAYKPFATKADPNQYPLSFLIGVMQTSNIMMVANFIDEQGGRNEVCHPTQSPEMCRSLAKQALSVIPVHIEQRNVKEDYCELALKYDWMNLQAYASPVTSWSEASDQYDSLRIQHAGELAASIGSLSIAASDCLISYAGNVTTGLVSNTPAAKFYESGINQAEQQAAEDERQLALKRQAIEKAMERAINDLVTSDTIDNELTANIYSEAVNTAIASLAASGKYPDVDAATVKKVVTADAIKHNITQNIMRIAEQLASTEFTAQPQEILLKSELVAAQDAFRAKVESLLSTYRNNGQDTSELQGKVIEAFNHKIEQQFKANNKPVAQLAEDKRQQLLATVNKASLLSDDGLQSEFKRLQNEASTFSKRINHPVFNETHISLLEDVRHNYLLQLQQEARANRMANVFQEGDVWQWSAQCSAGEVVYNFDFSDFSKLDIQQRSKSKVWFVKFPVTYSGYATNRKKETRAATADGTIKVEYSVSNRAGSNVLLTMFKLRSGLKGYKLQSIGNNRFKLADSALSLVSKGKSDCADEKFELVRGADLEILQYSGL